MFELRCTVRKCRRLLELRDNALFCEAGHHFDRAKSGYWSLLQPQDRKSLKPGDSEAAVLARHRWVERGHMAGLVESLRPWISKTEENADPANLRTLDLGCGEGSFGRALFPKGAESFCGIDLSKRAMKLAARGWREATWVLANADRILPATDASVHRIVSLFGRRPVEEIERVLVPDGVCIVAVPGEEDLIELREKVQQTGHRRSRWEAIVEEMASAGLEHIDHQQWTHRVELDPEEISDALTMTYRAVRHSEQARAESLGKMNVTLAADLVLLRKK